MSLRNILLTGFTVSLCLAAFGADDQTLQDPFDETPYLTMYRLLPTIYKMTPPQTVTFNALLNRLTLDYHEYLAVKEEQVNQVRLEYFDMQADRAQGKTIAQTKQRALHKRRSDLIMASPLGVNNVTAEAEKFLTPKQITAAHGKRKPTTRPATTQPTTQPSTQPATTQPTTQPTSAPATCCARHTPTPPLLTPPMKYPG